MTMVCVPLLILGQELEEPSTIFHPSSSRKSGREMVVFNVLLIFSSHFFERYIERFLELNKDEKQYLSLIHISVATG